VFLFFEKDFKSIPYGFTAGRPISSAAAAAKKRASQRSIIIDAHCSACTRARAAAQPTLPEQAHNPVVALTHTQTCTPALQSTARASERASEQAAMAEGVRGNVKNPAIRRIHAVSPLLQWEDHH